MSTIHLPLFRAVTLWCKMQKIRNRIDRFTGEIIVHKPMSYHAGEIR